jgi:hypothetical protein
LKSVKDDEEKLEKLLSFMEEEFLSDIDVGDAEDIDYKEQIPGKYREVVQMIAGDLSGDHICFYNPDTLEVRDIPTAIEWT